MVHIPAYSHSALAEILDRVGALPVSVAVGGELLDPGRAYVPPPDRDLLAAVPHALVRPARGLGRHPRGDEMDRR